MQNNIWVTLPRPFFVLAPMEDVTDTVYRQIVARCGRPNLFFTEFTNVDGILSIATEKVSQRLRFLPIEKPLIAQIWGNNPESFRKVAQLLSQKNFDGIDINMGCPDSGVVKKKAGGGLIKDPVLAAEIIIATKEGAGELPVSVKTRIGYNKIITEEWVTHLLSQKIDALTVHGRTVSEGSKVPAHWDEIGKAVVIRDSLQLQTKIIGNGDVMSYQQGLDLAKQYHLDGIMVGRGIFANPWFFNPTIDITQVSLQERCDMLVTHMNLFLDVWKGSKNFDILKKFFKAYLRDFEGANELRTELMMKKTPEEIQEAIQKYLHK